ncbi:MAG: FimB/Mfa2 family fimbrial subunit, partial [Odoribacteraceae bacterium]|nr:FimB/Mfa2 family fimbrial subunit [Odoribacteraceae bacterium]
MKTTITSLLASLAVILSTLFTSCIRDYYVGGAPVDDDETALVTLSLSVPETPATRADATVAENAIEAIDVLLFNASDKFYYRAHGTQITNDGSTPYATKKFGVRLPVGGPYNIVVLANARAALTSLAVATIVTSGSSRVDVLNAITNDGVALTTNFPMWGHVASVTIAGNTSNITSTIQLTRAVARLDVSVKSGVSNFTLTGA